MVVRLPGMPWSNRQQGPLLQALRTGGGRMSRVDIERNAEIAMMRKEGATFLEIAEWYEISPQRAKQICEKFSDGDTKDEIIRNWERKQEEKREKRMEESLEYRRLAEKRKNGRVINSIESS